MKAVKFNEFGGPEVLQLVEADEPHAKAGQIRIAVKAVGINPAEWKIRAGYFQEHMPISFPSGIGFEASGVVDEVGEGAVGISVGDAVFGFGINTVAEYAVLTNWSKKTKELSFEEAAGYPTVVETATRVLGLVNLKKGDTILVDGAAGGVGTAMIQFARYRGFHVIGTASESKHEYLRSFGVVPTTYGPGLADRVKKLAPNGVNAAFDFAGAGSVPELVDLVGVPTSVVTIADMPALGKYGVLGAFSGNQKNPELVFQEATKMHSTGNFKMPIDDVFPIERIADAHRKSESKRVKGKVVVKIS